MLKTTFTLFSLALLLGSCAELTVRKANSTDEEGVRFRRPKPYLVVTEEAGEKGPVLSMEIAMLPDPDPDQEYLIGWKSGWFGTVTPSFTLTDGWNLTGMDSTVESGGSSALTSLAEVVGAVAGLRTREGGKPLSVGVYPLETGVDAQGVKRWTLGQNLLDTGK